jgi:arylsulfatase A-like enzyme
MVQNLDFAETILDMAGLPIPADMQGKSIVPVLKGKQKGDVHDALYYHFYENQEHKVAKHIGVRTDRYKLIYFYENKEWELYDLDKDNHEMKNVYNDPAYAKVQKMMKEKLEELRKQYNDPVTIVSGN